ncbi:uncharacterized protein PV09_02613 [Verruconis gallopava]|uniref:Uncharacterized protein n=1 Tax=Verruconis gallopava TaxID=253628 RepID=A0A0D1Z1Z9_9PEZI|nr:uncharacterized protein PV09_02613 [Verruconis gallopava]KIW06952.1 hypothetical protein PV09_02613 [Verruconis gallopava]
MLASKDHDLHRKRRAVLNPYFSQQSVRRLEPVINDTLSNLLFRMEGWGRAGEVVNMNVPFRAATKDIIQDCNAPFFDVLTPQRICHLGTHVYWLAWIMARLPPSLMIALLPRVGVFAKFMQDLTAQIEHIRNAKEHPEGKTIFHEIIRSDIPDSEKETKRLADEAMVILIAGSETTASTLAAIMYHLLSDRPMLARLKKELEDAFPDANQLPDASKLDKLPFLNAIIQEAIRLYPGATHRQDRIAPDEDLVLESSDGGTFVIPAGTPVGMSPSTINRHPALYGPDPDVFRPDRYLENPRLARHNFSFSKGGRACIGMNLACQELQSLTAGIFRKYDAFDPEATDQVGPTLELFETVREDVAMYADYITICPRPGSKGLRVKIRN